jgi:hypothetical protein
VRPPLLGRLVTSPIAFLIGAVADLVIYGMEALRRARRVRAERSRRAHPSA